MQFKGMNLCDFCFEPVNAGGKCAKCGLDHEKYQVSADLLPPGTNLLGKYIIGRVLGRGGFGATYLAYSSELDKAVAIKEYFPTGIASRVKGEEKVSIVSNDKLSVFDKGAKRFFEEAKTMSRFNTNKNVVSVYEFFYANDTVYYSMEYLEGIDLKSYITKKGGRLSEGESVTIMRGVCDALVAIHSTGTLHRDISPDNIFICTNGEVKLIDFGAAKQVVGEHAQQNYSVVVKQGFAPAEQYKTNGRQGMWTDIYAVGATIYYALTGEVPVDAMNRVESPDIVFDPALNITPQFSDIISKCLQSRIEDRYQSAIELLGALEQLNVSNTAIGGNDFVQTVYSGVGSSGLSGAAVQFGGGTAQQQYPQSGYNPFASQYPNSQTPQTYYPNSQMPPNMTYYPPQEDKEKSGMVKGIVIGAAILLIVALIIVLIVVLTGPPQQGVVPPPWQGGPQQGVVPPPPGGMMPQGGQPMP